MDLINKGMRHLDAVKHCQDKMTPQMREHDYTMRDTPPAEWTESQVLVAEMIDRYVNGDLYKTSPWIPVSLQAPPRGEPVVYARPKPGKNKWHVGIAYWTVSDRWNPECESRHAPNGFTHWKPLGPTPNEPQ